MILFAKLRLRRTNNHVCPWWLCYSFDNPLRRLFHDPERLLGPYVKLGMTVADIGCGMGYFTLGLARLTGPEGKVIAVDLQERMLAALESRFNLKIRDGEIIGIFTVRDLIGFIEAKHPEAAREPEAEPAAWARVLMTEPDAALLRRLGMAGGLTARLVTQGLAALM